jgi:hypothetical protein
MSREMEVRGRMRRNTDTCCLSFRPMLKNISGRLTDKPVLGLLGSLLDDYQYLWGNYYFSSATL